MLLIFPEQIEMIKLVVGEGCKSVQVPCFHRLCHVVVNLGLAWPFFVDLQIMALANRVDFSFAVS